MVIRHIKNFMQQANLPPIQCAALGALFGFYFLFKTVLTFIIIIVFALLFLTCLFRVLSSLNKNSRFLHFTNVCSAAFTIGIFIGLCAAYSGRGEINFGIPEKNVIAVEGVLLEDPRIVSSGSAMVTLSLRKSAGEKGLRVSGKGEITVFFTPDNAHKIREYGRGTRIYAEGVIRSNERGVSISAKSLHIVKPAPAIERMRTGIRLNLINRFGNTEWGGLALALLLGIRDNMDSEFTNLYRSAGLSYILALSGMHLAIIAALISFLLKKPLGLKASAITGAVIIILYCLLVGPMPSLNRAALMYVLGVFAILGALPKKAMSILSFSFLIQIIVTPAAGNTLSFILSYLALLGILITGQTLSSLLSGKIPDFILQPLSLSVGAFLITSGICSFTFGIIAPVGIIAGLVIVPLTTVFMIGSMIWLILDFISISFLLNFPLYIIYKLMEITASIAGNVPGISANPVLVLVISIILIIIIYALEYKRKEALLRSEPFL
jgi:competence protein ComEC